MSGTSAEKRPAEEPAADAPPTKRRITRSCDQCKNTQYRCSGFLPCQICTMKGKQCTYNPVTRRGGRLRTPPPPPADAEDPDKVRHAAKGRVERDKIKRFRSWDSLACDACRVLKIERCSGKIPCEHCFEKRIECSYRLQPDLYGIGAPRNEPLPDPSQFQPRSPGPLDPELEKLQPARRYAHEETPPLAFLHRAWRTMADPSSPASMRPSDQPFDRSSPFRLPPEHRWEELLSEFFGGFSAVFQILHRPSVKKWAAAVQQNDAAGLDLWHGIGRMKAAIVLMALALGSFFRDRAHRDKKANKPDEWIWSLNFGDNLFTTSIVYTDVEDGYPTLESAQVRLLQDIYLLCTSRFLQAWNTFGNTLQTITALGYHRRIGRNRGLGLHVSIKPDYSRLQCERRLFWSVYILDRQISSMLGKPCQFSDDTIDQNLPDPVNDEDCDENGPIRAHPIDCYITALVHYAKLNKIFERIYSEVYTLRDVPEEERLECAARLAGDVEAWQRNLPPLMQQRETALLSIFRRQSTILRLAYYHAQMLVYRPFLTAPYPHWGDKKRLADHAVKEVLEVARHTSVMFFDLARNLQPRMFGTIWYAHQVGYIAAGIIYFTPHFRERQSLFGGPHYRGYEGTDEKRKEIADRMTDILDTGTNPYSPGPRFAAILKELKAEAERQLNPNNPPYVPNREESLAMSPSEQLLADALRADWEADLSGHSTWNPQNPTQGAAPGGPKRLWDTFKITDWNDFDSAAFGPINDFIPFGGRQL
ncbi:fungal-specific transcription factor domain-containing protein [Podospora aff. communis PSN243]|uniref:Fungal-specific transcription factor domain-containing protein n=1 Tax=Podospora aff. communis PSN243 TaxID=3040156 RepID=A0AAV9G9I5_9PEZI|nr:fungal-specific transcription factor domain-containing protein [Podospora aff. communis PSN243]